MYSTKIKIGENASVYTTEDITATAEVKQSGAIINVSFIAACEASVASGFYASSKVASS